MHMFKSMSIYGNVKRNMPAPKAAFVSEYVVTQGLHATLLYV